ncbi:MAG: DUF2939 domain-containing protein [Hyphomicrobiaceae bacterium]|nr:DUF2939 domain-containing protein [Hyphomicrobiaceae bacterium]
MFRLLTLLLIVGLAGFYVVWPAWSGYQIKAALDAQDAAGLSRKIDFDRVRASMRPAVTAEVEKSLTAVATASGQPAEALVRLKADAMPKLVDSALNGLVTPESVIRIYRDRADPKAAVAKIVAEKLASPEGFQLLGSIAGAVTPGRADAGSIIGQLGRMAEQSGIDPGKVLGGLLGKKGDAAAEAKPVAGGGAAGVGIDNVKSFAMNGLTGYSIGIAKDKSATKPDLVADIAFTGADWKLVGLAPRS